MVTYNSATLVAAISAGAYPLTGATDQYDPLLQMIGPARVVLLGEASHGTHEFYRERAQITKRLISEKGVTAVAVEADWPDAYRVNRYVRGAPAPEDAEAIDALAGFQRFPTWMWRNADVLDFVGWLRAYNDALPPGVPRVGFYGLDLYSLHASIDAVLAYLDRVDPAAARRARRRYACFEYVGSDTHAYGYATSLGLAPSCEDAVVSQLVDLHHHAAAYARMDGRAAADAYFYAEQNARLARNAEHYYRTMFQGHVASWNLRDRHMSETLTALIAHLRQVEPAGGPAKVVVWAHNSHVGDARATDLGRAGELTLGQLVREQAGVDAVLVGFSTYSGTVTAAADWDAPSERKVVRPALEGSYEALFHATERPRFLLRLADPALAGLREPRLQRAIGVVYRPQTERLSHYIEACLPEQFDALIHLDQTRAVEPLERTARWEAGEVPETYPSAL